MTHTVVYNSDDVMLARTVHHTGRAHADDFGSLCGQSRPKRPLTVDGQRGTWHRAEGGAVDRLLKRERRDKAALDVDWPAISVPRTGCTPDQS